MPDTTHQRKMIDSIEKLLKDAYMVDIMERRIINSNQEQGDLSVHSLRSFSRDDMGKRWVRRGAKVADFEPGSLSRRDKLIYTAGVGMNYSNNRFSYAALSYQSTLSCRATHRAFRCEAETSPRSISPY